MSGPIRNGAQYVWQLGQSMDALRARLDRQGLDAQALHFGQTRAEYTACHPVWRRVPGGRAAHAFYDGADTPLCGVDPVRASGERPRWLDARPRDRFLRHHECERLAATATGERLSALFRRQREEVERA